MTPLDAVIAAALLQALADTQGQPPRVPPRPIPVVSAPAPPPPRRVSPVVVFTSGFESNVNRDREDLDALGMSLGAGLVFVDNPRKPTLEATYQAGFHRYSGTNRWNRISHFARVSWERSVARDWTVDVAGEMALKGSAEDRELGDQYLVTPRVEFKLDSLFRVRAFATYRLRRYPTDPGRNATNRYVGGELLGRPSGGARWEVGGRVEENATIEARRTYHRYTVYGGWEQPVGRRSRIETGLKVRLQRYPNRLVDIDGGPDVPRRDVRVEPEVSWVRMLGRSELRVTYGYERRTSNDPSRGYGAHAVAISITARR